MLMGVGKGEKQQEAQKEKGFGKGDRISEDTFEYV